MITAQDRRQLELAHTFFDDVPAGRRYEIYAAFDHVLDRINDANRKESSMLNEIDVTHDRDVVNLIGKYRSARIRRDKAKAEVEDIRDSLLAYADIEGATALRIAGKIAVRIVTPSSPRFDLAAFTIKHPRLAKAFTLVSAGTRQVRVTR